MSALKEEIRQFFDEYFNSIFWKPKGAGYQVSDLEMAYVDGYKQGRKHGYDNGYEEGFDHGRDA